MADADAKSLAADDLCGSQIAGRYTLVRCVGRGAYGAVWAATDALHHVDVAIKLQPVGDGRRVESLRHEMATLRWLRLPGVASIRDEGQDGGVAFAVMDLVDGAPFGAAHTAHGPASWDALAPATRSLLDTLARVHVHGIVHRDLKPDNVLVDASGCATILDFGLVLNPALGDHGRRRMGGTPRYLAPEQLRGRGIDARSDLYAVGVMLFHVLSGEWPHVAADRDALFRAKLSQPARALRAVAPAVPVHVADVVDALLAFRPAVRPRSADEVAAALFGSGDDAVDALLADAEPGGVVDEATARSWFVGPQRVFRIPSDGASVLLGRTGGDLDEIRDELASWRRAGLARINELGVHVDRSALDRLRAGFRTRRLARVPAGGIRDADAEWLRWLDLAAPALSLEAVAAAAERSDADARAATARLVDAGLAIPAQGGRSRPALRVASDGSMLDRRRIHARLCEAAPDGSVAAVWHAMGAGDRALLDATSTAFARAAVTGGVVSVPRALELIELSLQALGADAWASDERIEALTDLALRSNQLDAVHRARYLLEQGWRDDWPAGARAAARLDAARLARQGDGARAMQLLTPWLRYATPSWDAGIHFVASALSVDDHEALIEQYVEALDANGSPPLASTLAGWRLRSRLAYRQHRFEDAARLDAEIAAETRSPRTRLSALLNAASSWLEAHQPERAEALCDEAMPLVEDIAEPLFTLRWEWLRRAAAYRAERDLAPDEELCSALEGAGPAWQVGLMVLTEAGFAMRRANTDRAAALFGRASDAFAGGHLRDPWLHAAAFRDLLLGSPWTSSHDEMVDLAENASIPGAAMQAAAALIQRPDAPRGRLTAVIEQCATRLGAEPPTRRRETLSLAECVEATRRTDTDIQ